MKYEAGFELGRFELTSKSVQTFPKSYAGRIRDGSTFAYKSKDWSKMIQSRIWINGSSDAKFCQLSNAALTFWIRNLVMEQNGFFWLDPIPFHGFLNVRKKLSIVTVWWLTAHSVWTCQRWPLLKSPLKNVLNFDFLTVFGLWISSVEWAVFFTNISSFFQGQNKNLFSGGSAFTVDRAGLRLAASNTVELLSNDLYWSREQRAIQTRNLLCREFQNIERNTLFQAI